MVTGEMLAPAANHPKRIRHGADGAKLISSNDKTGYNFRFRGRFELPEQAYGTWEYDHQKAHSALRWLIATAGIPEWRSSYRRLGGKRKTIPKVIAGSDELRLRRWNEDIEWFRTTFQRRLQERYKGDAGQLFAKQMNSLIRGLCREAGGPRGYRSDGFRLRHEG